MQTGGTIQASDVATLYQTMNAFTIPGTIGIWQQGLVDNNRYQSTGTGTIDWSVSNPANKAVFFLIPFVWSASTGVSTFTFRLNGASATTSTGLSFTSVSSGEGMIAGFLGPRSTDLTRGGIMIGHDSATAGTLRSGGISTPLTTADTTSIGFLTGTGTATTFVFNGVRIWIEG